MTIVMDFICRKSKIKLVLKHEDDEFTIGLVHNKLTFVTKIKSTPK